MSIALKLMGSVLLVAAGAMIGWQKSSRARQAALVLQQMERLIVQIENEITYRATPLPEILARLKTDLSFGALNLAGCTNLRCYLPPDALAHQHWKQLKPFFQNLGQATATESQNQSQYYQNLCKEWHTAAHEEACIANKLYTKIGICCGALSALMLL